MSGCVSVSHKDESAPILALWDPKSGVWTVSSTPNPKCFVHFALFSCFQIRAVAAGSWGLWKTRKMNQHSSFWPGMKSPTDKGTEAHRATAQHVVGTVSLEKGEILSEQLPGEPCGQKEPLRWLFHELPT